MIQFKKYCTCLFLGIIGCLPSTAQYEEKNFTRYSVRDGLTDNVITCLQQDDWGYLWIGTDAGLNRYDGKKFKQFYQGQKPLYLPGSIVSRLKRFGPHQLGIITRAGFQVLNTKDFTIRNFIVPDSSAFSPQLNAVWEAFELADQSFAITTASGFYKFNPKGQLELRHDAFNIKDIGKKRILYGRNYFKLSDRKWLIYINESGVAVYDDEKKTFREQDMRDPNWNIFIHDKHLDSVHWVVKYQLNATTYIFIPALKNQVVTYDRVSGRMMAAPLPAHLTDSLSWESQMMKLDDSTFALNSRTNGFYLFKLNSKTGLMSCDGKKHLPGYKIMCLYIDKDKRLWAGTTEGLLKQELQPPALSAYRFLPEGGQKFTGGFSAAIRHKNKLYAARFSNGKGLAIIDPVEMKLIKEIDLFGSNSQWNEIRSIEMYYPDTLWIGSNAGLIWYDTKTDRYGKLIDDPRFTWSKNFSAVLSPAREDGYTWMVQMLGGKLVRYHIASRTVTIFTAQTKPALPFDKVKHVVYDAYGDVWIGGHSLTRWNNKIGDFDTLITVYGGPNKFNDDIVAMRADNKGSLWIHNVANGLLEYRIREKKFIAYGMKDGLPSEMILAMSPVVDDKVWVAANNHLSLFDTRKKQFTIYDHDDGLPEQKPTGRRIYFDQERGQLYLFCNEWLVRFPFLPERKKDLSGELLIEELRVENRDIHYQPGGNIVVRHNDNNLALDYSIIDFEKSNYQFAWRLNNSDSWNVVGDQRSINLSNLPPGHYDIQIKASGKPGVEKTNTFSFSVKPPVWKRTWFIGLAILLLVGGTWLLYRRRIRNIRQKANVDKMLSQTEMKALQAQMNPHFIFNSLNSIREMILNNENKDASHYLSKFAHLIRITLDQSSQALVSLRHTIDYLERYMEMESIRNSLFTHEIIVDKTLDLDEIVVPPMLIQPFIENGLWHGVAANNKKIHIRIHFKKENENLVCTIDDDGMGLIQSQKIKPGDASRYRSHGIANIKNRVGLLNEKYGLNAQVTIQDKTEITGNGETGTLVTLQLPLEINES